MPSGYDVIVVGAGIFGVTTALALRERGHHVALLDPGPLPHPLAASTDISKVIRMEYGADEEYMAMVEEAREGWLAWNELFGQPLYHEVGVTMLTRAPMAPGGYEYESYQMLLKRGHRPDRLDAAEITRRFPAWRPGHYVDGYFHARGGYAESGRVVAALVGHAQKQGVEVHAGQTVDGFLEEGGRVVGVHTREGQTFPGGLVVVAAGTWSWLLVPELAAVMKSVGQPVFHLKPADPALFTPPHFVVFTADVSHTGWYGFPLHPHEGVVKVANHGVGWRLHPARDERVVGESEVIKLRAFLADTFPALAEAPIVYTRCCVYCDTLDEHFWIDHHPERPGLVVAAGGSGHGFKFGPMLGGLIADVVERRPNPYTHKFCWRELAMGTAGEEAARHHRR
ncbi:MAG: FAD-dependent oxidoreductase [Chloroflexi bacterium]|nr:FAD-dependent oxidoreductase [Chloroflexota bacterium]MCI0578698.1 FAD-dependent oxidoreductase [Chloroflexota bacterium]MCI0648358.1 FAD-dependent oxidoreductase [Chloroflexota bacterium]MCI0731174.1 FAD-dependent oxidoreductase [Chloroflexota bacterium]